MAFDDHHSAGITGLVLPAARAPAGLARIVNPNAAPDAIAIQLQVLDGQVIVDFGRPVEWIKLTDAEASKLSADLETCVRYARTLHLSSEGEA